MKSFIRNCLLFFIGILLVACEGLIPQKIVLRPTFDVSVESVANAVNVGVKVLDERSDKFIGYQRTGLIVESRGAKISTDQDVAIVIYESISDGLQKKGFKPLPFAENHKKSLKIEIRLIEYTTSSDFWSPIAHTKGAIKAFAYNGEEAYEKFYRSQDERRVSFDVPVEANEKMINQTISGVLTKLFQDHTLLEFLAK